MRVGIAKSQVRWEILCWFSLPSTNTLQAHIYKPAVELLQVGHKLSPAGGWAVDAVMAESPAEEAGILQGERILEIGEPHCVMDTLHELNMVRCSLVTSPQSCGCSQI